MFASKVDVTFGNAGRALRPVLLSSSALVLLGLGASDPAHAQCAADVGTPSQVVCSGTDADGYSNFNDAITVTVEQAGTVNGQIALDDNNFIVNNGTIADIVVDNGNDVTNNGKITKLVYIGNTNTIHNTGEIAVANSEAIYSAEQNNSVENNGSISTTGNSREAIQLLGDASIVTGSGSISTQGNTAEGIELGTNAIVTYSGSIDTVGASSHAINVGAGSTVTLKDGAAITTSGAGAIGVYNLDDGVSVTVVEDGASIVTTGAGSSAIIDADDAQITVDGLLQTSGANAHAIDIDDDSTVTVGATGSIVTSGDGARALVLGRRSTLENAGSIEATGLGADGVLFDEGQATLTNSGSITSAQAYGVLIDDDEPGTSSVITNLAGGSITGVSGSIAVAGTAEIDATEETVLNYGSLTGDVSLGAGKDKFALYGAGSVTGSVSLGLGNDQFYVEDANTGLIMGTIDGGEGFDRVDARFYADGSLDLSQTTNFEFYTVEANGAETDVTILDGSLNAPLALYSVGTITNNADVTAVDDEAITLVDAGGHLVNRGTLSTTGAGAEALMAGDDATIRHEGAILTDGEDSEGIQASDNARITVAVGSNVETKGAGSEGVQAADGSTVTIGGTVVTRGNDSEGVQLNEIARVTIAQGGSISTMGQGSEGIQALDSATITIDGHVQTNGVYSDAVSAGQGATITVGGTGIVQSTAEGTFALTLGQGGSVVNKGLISATGSGNAAAIFLGEGVSSLTNEGRIVSASDAAIFISDGNGSSPSYIANLAGGEIAGAEGSIIAYSTDNPTVERVTNAGALIGNVELYAGDDSFTHMAGGSFTGEMIDLGAGNDTFTMSGGSLNDIDGLIYGGSGHDTFVYQSGASTIEAAQVYAFEELEQRSGVLTTTDDLTFGTITIEGGTLYLSTGTRVLPNDFNNPAARSVVTVGAAGELAGAGEVVGSVVNDGLIAVDAGHTMSIAGDLSLNAGSLLAIDLTDADIVSLEVGGVTTLDGGTVQIDGIVSDSRTITILHSTGGISDEAGLDLLFDASVPFTRVSDVIVSGDSVSVRVDQLLRDPTLHAPAAAVGEYIFGQLAGADETLLAVLTEVSDATDRSNLDAVLRGLSPEIYASAPVVANIGQYRATMGALTGTLTNFDVEGVRLWTSIAGSDADYGSDGSVSAFDTNSLNSVSGIDTAVSANLRLGLFGAIGDTETRFDANSGAMDGTQYTLGAYAILRAGDFALTGAASYSAASYDGSRPLAGGVLDDAVSFDFDSSTFAFHLGGIWRAPLEVVQLTATTSFDYLAMKRDAFAESGGNPLALVVDVQKLDVPLAEVGLELGKPVDLGDLTLLPSAGIRFVHNFSDTRYQASAHFAGGDSQRLALGSVTLPDDLVEATLGLGLSGKAWSLRGDATYGSGADFDSVGGRLTFDYRF
ncbi:hypothetical protein SZ64_10210 [Erythrobacter sp. SG61-1L]|uniref:autotransporter domain-containing protein n=1 Tax=Erythrobacter sp. SG61-1L TaxID=1603897 RepID=UPI0006C930E1|nr:autotransporter domain-containing protein [Erythrobacter sp. SG61-1L]KPL68456.1 hypothetical protein SZ64_10210 [Erythrobacter sp. SG61-1L]